MLKIVLKATNPMTVVKTREIIHVNVFSEFYNRAIDEKYPSLQRFIGRYSNDRRHISPATIDRS